jgi:hypothetical protein
MNNILTKQSNTVKRVRNAFKVGLKRSFLDITLSVYNRFPPLKVLLGQDSFFSYNKWYEKTSKWTNYWGYIIFFTYLTNIFLSSTFNTWCDQSLLTLYTLLYKFNLFSQVSPDLFFLFCYNFFFISNLKNRNGLLHFGCWSIHLSLFALQRAYTHTKLRINWFLSQLLTTTAWRMFLSPGRHIWYLCLFFFILNKDRLTKAG